MALPPKQAQPLVDDSGRMDRTWYLWATQQSNVVTIGKPAHPQNGQAWIEVSGVSPSRVYALNYQDGTTTVTIASVVG